MRLKQSTAVAISFGPFLDPTDGVTLVTGAVSAIDNGTTGIKLSKNGGALTIRHATVTASTYDAYGNYIVTLDTTDTNTLGTLRVQFAAAATCLPVWMDYEVVNANEWDSSFGTSVRKFTDVDQIKTNPVVNGGTVTFPTTATLASTTNITAGTITTATNLTNAPTAGDFTATMKTSIGTAVAASAVASVTGAVGSIGTGGIAAASFAAGAIDNAAIAADAIGSSELATSAVTEIANGLLDQTDGIETGITPRSGLKLQTAAAAGKLSGAATTTVVIRNAAADSKDRITATVDANGNRSAITLDLT